MGRKRKKKLTPDIETCKELDGWKIDDYAWAIRPNGDVFRGTIIQFFEGEMVAQMWDDQGNGIMIAELSTLEETSSKKKMKIKAKQYKEKMDRLSYTKDI